MRCHRTILIAHSQYGKRFLPSTLSIIFDEKVKMIHVFGDKGLDDLDKTIRSIWSHLTIATTPLPTMLARMRQKPLLAVETRLLIARSHTRIATIRLHDPRLARIRQISL